jgi:hypothetical protein
MITWIDIEDSQGNKLGKGPLGGVLSSSFGEKLSEAAEFSFTVLSNGAGTELIEHERVAVRYVVKDDVTWRHSGIIKNIQLTLSGNGLPTLEVSGFTLLYELSYSLINIELYELVSKKPYVMYEDEFIDSHNNGQPWIKWAMFDNNPSTHERVRISLNNSFLYIAYPVAFIEINFDLKRGNRGHSDYGWYWRGENWILLTPEENGLIDETGPLARSGRVKFTPSRSWRKRSFNGAIPNSYSIKFDPAYGDDVDVDICEVSIIAKGPTYNDLAPLLAGTDWSFHGHQNTGRASRMMLWDISRLEALTKLRKHHGHHFRQFNGERKIEWLRETDIGEDSGITAIKLPVGKVMKSAGIDMCFVKDARKLVESYEIVTHLRPYGGGKGSERATLIDAAIDIPEGYYLDSSSNFIISAEAEATFGRRIERVEQFGEVTPAVDFIGNLDDDDTSNQLARAALSWLQNHDKAHIAYELSVVGLRKMPKVGQKIRIEYHDSSSNIHIDDTLFLIGYDMISQAGLVFHKLTVSSIARFPKGEGEFISRKVQELRELQAYGQAVSKIEHPLLTDENTEKLQISASTILDDVENLETRMRELYE